MYSIALRSLWQPTGLQRVADALLHDVMPIVWIAYWLVFAQRGRVAWRVLPLWLLYPVAWFGWILLRGEWTGFYPYPFIDVTSIGYARTVSNAVVVIGLFILVALIVTAVGSLLAPLQMHPGVPDDSLQPVLPGLPLHGHPQRPTADH